VTEYAYKLVSLKLGGQPDWLALERALKRGWEPVPLGEEPNPFPNPMGMTHEQMANFKLCRMSKDKHDEQREEREFLNAALLDRRVHIAIAVGNVPGAEALQLEGAVYASDGSATDLSVLPEDTLFAKKVAVAHKWLRERGLV
jgi:hypothetical protein